MALNDTQIERFSRQIVLPQIGGIGQERLLAASVAIGGPGAAACIAARYLTGAGVGRVALYGGDMHGLALELSQLDPAATVSVETGPMADTASDMLVAADLARAELDAAAGCGRALVAGGGRGVLGWVVAAPRGVPCASCAARQSAPRHASGASPLASITAGVIGSLLALEALKFLLDLPGAAHGVGLQFDAEASTLGALPLERADDCPRCAAA